VGFSLDGKAVLTASKDQTVRLWKPAPFRPYLREIRHDAQVMTVALSPDGKTLVSGTDDKGAWRWEVASGELLAGELHHDDVWPVAFSPDGKTILTAGRDRTVRLWDAAAPGRRPRHTLRHPYRVRGAVFSPDGATVVTGG